MPFRINPFTGELDYYEASTFKGVLASEPSNPVVGWSYINSTDHTLYFYYGVSWQSSGITFIPAANVNLVNEDGTPLTNEDGTTLQREP